MIYQYSVSYLRRPASRRVWHMVVEARDADEARRIAAVKDPLFTSTIASPRRGKAVVRA